MVFKRFRMIFKIFLPFFDFVSPHNYQSAEMSSMAVVETLRCKYGSFVTNNITFVAAAKYFLQFKFSIYLCIVMNI